MEELTPSHAPEVPHLEATPEAETYAALAARGARHLQRGEFEAALETYSAALVIARALDDQARIDRAELNRSMVLLQMGEARRAEEGLREILLRTDEPEVAWSAAYNLASSLRRQGRYEQALRYARRAMERARALGTPEALAPVHNVLGNIHLSRSYLDEALAEYETALELRRVQAGDTRFSRAILEENIGYCLLLRKQFDEGMARIHEALRLAREVGDGRCRAECLQDLCYGLLLQGRHEEALPMGEAAMAAAREMGFLDIVENCNYLLGELGTRTENHAMRDRHFQELQQMHPELPFLKDFLCSVDVTGIITLKR